jgi:hypothetical protein
MAAAIRKVCEFSDSDTPIESRKNCTQYVRRIHRILVARHWAGFDFALLGGVSSVRRFARDAECAAGVSEPSTIS